MMLEAEVRPMTDDDVVSIPSAHLGKTFRRSLSAHPSQGHDKDRVSFVAAVHMPGTENPVLQSMCKLLTSLLRLPAAGKPSNLRSALADHPTVSADSKLKVTSHVSSCEPPESPFVPHN